MNTHANTNSDVENLMLNDVPGEIGPASDVGCAVMADGIEDEALDELDEILFAIYVAEERRAMVVEFREACAREFWVEDVLSLARDGRDGPGWCSLCGDDFLDPAPDSAARESASQNIDVHLEHASQVSAIRGASQNRIGGSGRAIFDLWAPPPAARKGASQNHGHGSGWEIPDLRNLPRRPVDRESQKFDPPPPLCTHHPPCAGWAFGGESQNTAAHPPPHHPEGLNHIET